MEVRQDIRDPGVPLPVQCVMPPPERADGVFAAGHLGELTQIVPFEMVDEVLAATGAVQRRTRRLPSRVVVYLLLAAGLFAELGYEQVWSRLTATITSSVPAPARACLLIV